MNMNISGVRGGEHSRKSRKPIRMHLHLLGDIIIDFDRQFLRINGIPNILYTGRSIRQNLESDTVLLGKVQSDRINVIDLGDVLVNICREKASPPTGLFLEAG